MVIVVNMRTCIPPWGQDGDVRIDRNTKWGNPYPLHNDTPSNRAVVITKYEEWLDAKLELGQLNLDELKGVRRLGCWCKPKQCHGDIIKKKIDALIKSSQTKLSAGDFK